MKPLRQFLVMFLSAVRIQKHIFTLDYVQIIQVCDKEVTKSF